MQNIKGFILFFISVALTFCAAVSSFDLVMCVSAVRVQSNTQIQAPTGSENNETAEVTSSDKQVTQNVSSKQSTSSQAVPTGTKSEALGKVVTKTLSFTSSLNYNGVHIRNLTDKELSIKKYITSKCGTTLSSNSAPQVLVYHTHATESYMTEERDYYTDLDQTRSTDNSKNMVAIGKVFCSVLEENGIKTIHITEHFDNPAYTGSYSRSAAAVKKYLKKYPSIKVAIDLHRDSVSEGDTRVRPVVEVDGQSAAQVMLVMGSNTGNVKNYPDWEKNLSLAAKFQKKMADTHKGLARCMMVSSKLYNQNLSKGSMLIEIGTEANTLSQAKYAASLSAELLAKTLKELK